MAELEKLDKVNSDAVLTPAQDEEEKKGFPIWKIIYRNLWLIILLTVLCAGGAALYGFLNYRTTYTASCKVMLNISLDRESLETETKTDISLTRLYLNPCISYMTSNECMTLVNSAWQDKSSGGIYGINASALGTNSLIFQISYSDVSQELAKNKLSTFIYVASDYLNSNISKLASAKECSIKPIEREYFISEYHTGYNAVIIGAVAGLVGSIVLSCLIYLLDNKIKSASELEEIVGEGVIVYIEKIN